MLNLKKQNETKHKFWQLWLLYLISEKRAPLRKNRGSVKADKTGRKDGQPLPRKDEPLHVYATANNPENGKKAVEKVL